MQPASKTSQSSLLPLLCDITLNHHHHKIGGTIKLKQNINAQDDTLREQIQKMLSQANISNHARTGVLGTLNIRGRELSFSWKSSPQALSDVLFQSFSPESLRMEKVFSNFIPPTHPLENLKYVVLVDETMYSIEPLTFIEKIESLEITALVVQVNAFNKTKWNNLDVLTLHEMYVTHSSNLSLSRMENTPNVKLGISTQNGHLALFVTSGSPKFKGCVAFLAPNDESLMRTSNRFRRAMVEKGNTQRL